MDVHEIVRPGEFDTDKSSRLAENETYRFPFDRRDKSSILHSRNVLQSKPEIFELFDRSESGNKASLHRDRRAVHCLSAFFFLRLTDSI